MTPGRVARKGSAAAAEPSALQFINNAAPRRVGSARLQPRRGGGALGVSGGCCRPGRVTPSRATPAGRGEPWSVPLPLLPTPSPSPTRPGRGVAVVDARGDPTRGDVPKPHGGGADGDAQLAALPWRCAGANEPE